MNDTLGCGAIPRTRLPTSVTAVGEPRSLQLGLRVSFR
jgi:hypothetical protein